ncbi:HDOD domain-containing protein [uncultured Oxalicibacterium sp.]|uniref:HDOD domain-containing protein n=1 Tax=uncultured Oxalicibacterium sp. TaxID=1168540 RepID=UPI0025CD732B|nr:HDOD domain-containing protein [uncultured Oxalicibacterium sp.]
MTKQETPSLNAEKTLELLMTRVRQRGDLPGFSKVVSAIVGAMQGEDDREFSMTRTVLSDPTLTQRVLRLANSAMYSAFGQSINTVSKAVIVLGTETIGHLALGLKLIDGLSVASLGTSSTRHEMEKAVLAGQIARQVASTSTRRDTEEAVVCSILHSLGRLMVSFYLPEHWATVQQLATDDRMSENDAAQQVLGLPLDELGRLIGARWGLPSELVASLKELPPRVTDVDNEPLAHADWLAAVSTMSTRCATVLCENASASIEGLTLGYADMLGLDADVLLAAVESAHRTAKEDTPPTPKAEEADTQMQLPLGKPADSVNILKRGVSDLRGDLITASTSQLMTVALETVYKGLGLSRAVAFLRNHEESKYMARMCFGECLEELLPRLAFNDAYQPDVFHAALANNKMIFVEDAHAPGFASKLPRWWRDEMGLSRSFVILPLMLNFHPVGFIYGDWDASLPLSKIAPNEVALLDDLRAIIVKAIEHRCHMDPTWARAMH